jgi:hypothetical protein
MKRLAMFLLWVLCCSPCIAANAELTLNVDGSGKISADILIRRGTPVPSGPSTVEVFAVALPFRTGEGPRIQGPDDVPAGLLKRGDGYTIISVAIPSARQETTLRIADAFPLAESSEGKALAQVDLSYPFLSEADKLLLRSASALSIGKLVITLPRDFDDVEIGYNPPQLVKVNKRQYAIDLASPGASFNKIWLVFPNPMQSQLQIAKIVLALVIGCFTLLVHLPALKEQKLSWSVGVLVVSSLVFGLVAYYALSLSKRLEFAEWAAGSLPHVAYGLLTSLYLVFVARRQLMITGRVTRAGEPIQFADVQLWKHGKSGRVLEKRVETLSSDGRYAFRVRPKDGTDKFEITASTSGTVEVSSGKFDQGTDKRVERNVLDLAWKELPVKAN